MCVYMYIYIFLKELAKLIMETEKSRPRRADGVSSNLSPSLSPKAGED